MALEAEPLFAADDLVLRPVLGGHSSASEYIESFDLYFDSTLASSLAGTELVFAGDDSSQSTIIADSQAAIFLAAQEGTVVVTDAADLFVGTGTYTVESQASLSVWLDLENPPASLDLSAVEQAPTFTLFSDSSIDVSDVQYVAGEGLILNGGETVVAVSLADGHQAQLSILNEAGISEVGQEIYPNQEELSEINDVGDLGQVEDLMIDPPTLEALIESVEDVPTIDTADTTEVTTLDSSDLVIVSRADPLAMLYPDTSDTDNTDVSFDQSESGPVSPEISTSIDTVDLFFDDTTPAFDVWDSPDDYI